jgi:hypothetical protein
LAPPPLRGFLATTSRSAGLPRDGTQRLAVSAACRAPCRHPPISGGGVGTGLPTFRVKAADQARVASMPGTVWPISGHPPDSSWSNPTAPVSMPSRFVSTPQQRFALRSPSWSPPDASTSAFPSSLTTNGLQPTQHEAVWSLPPQGDSEGPQPSSSTQHRIHQDLLPIDLAFCVRGALGYGIPTPSVSCGFAPTAGGAVALRQANAW